jgi:hypothetical protein
MCEILAKPGFDITTSLEGFSGEREREGKGVYFCLYFLLIFTLGETYHAARSESTRTGLPDIPQRNDTTSSIWLPVTTSQRGNFLQFCIEVGGHIGTTSLDFLRNLPFTTSNTSSLGALPHFLTWGSLTWALQRTHCTSRRGVAKMIQVYPSIRADNHELPFGGLGPLGLPLLPTSPSSLSPSNRISRPSSTSSLATRGCLRLAWPPNSQALPPPLPLTPAFRS